MPHWEALVLVVLLATGGCGPTTSAGKGVEAAPASATEVSFSLPSASGELVTIPLPGAQRTVLDFFGPTCEPCAKKVPELVRRRPEIEQHGGKLLLVAVLGDRESTADAESALAKWGVRSNFLVDGSGASLREAGVKDLPATIIVDPNGHTRWRAPVDASADDVVHALQ